MNFPVWELEMGGGLLIAIVAILHVFVSHFAIGGGFFLVITERLAYRKGDQHLERYVTGHSKFFALVTLVFGAISGVGIWFTIGLVSPAATSSLIHIFVWGWATEWVFFLVEIAAAIVYYTTWNRIGRGAHLAVGWVYFVAAFLSLVVINGILTFMLTPGAWSENGSFWSGFLNPTYWPSLLARTAICVALAGVYALLTAVRIRRAETRSWLLRYAGGWALLGTLVAVPAMAWYYGALPAGSSEMVAGAHAITALAVKVVLGAGAALVLLSLAPLIVPRHIGMGTALLVALAALIAFGGFEWARESLRKPYVIAGYMYGNGLTVAESERLAAGEGLLASAVWSGQVAGAADADPGRDVFRIACRSCHTLDGYNGLRARLQGLDEQYIYELIRRSEHLRGRMPPFAGNQAEGRALAGYLFGKTDPHQAMVDGAEVFDKRCGVCHSRQGSYRPLYEVMEGNSREELIELIDSLADFDERMPPWSGSERDQGLLADHILSWYPDTDAE
jgi:mono/diheme cytochrome c family protein